MTEAVACAILIIAVVLAIVYLERAGDPAMVLVDAGFSARTVAPCITPPPGPRRIHERNA